MNVYIISGLGLDERAFQRLTFPSHHTVIPVEWPKHEREESLQAYCLKIAGLIDVTTPFSIIGLSFGGVIATELTPIIHPVHTILISGIATRHQLPWHLRILHRLKLHRLVPAQQMNRTSPLTRWFNNLPTQEDNNIITNIIKDTDPGFIKWAVDKIITWRDDTRSEGIYHIHGDADRLFPISSVHADKTIRGGGHFMVLTHAREISNILKERLG